ncbi:MAG: proline dehydrogenase family protein [Opitutaceae bacterium]|nr:proline dehydrogenase family protein [Opitutaceae bacterium]
MIPSVPPFDAALEQPTQDIARELIRRMEEAPSPGLLSRKGVHTQLMEWSVKDPAFKTQLFRFVDVLPVLRSNAEIVRHLQEYLGDKAVAINPAMKFGLAASGLAPGLIAGPVKSAVAAMARQFVAGESIDDLVRRIRHNAAIGFATTIDLLGESVVSDDEADMFLRRNLEVLEMVSVELERDKEVAFSDSALSGPLPRVNLSLKISALVPEIHPADPDRSIGALKQRLRIILRRAIAVGAFLNFDMESYRLKDLTLALFKSVLEESEFAAAPAMGIVLQAYLRETEQDLRELITWVRARGRPITVRLVKGAYWDYETVLANQRGWPVPVWSRKPESDANFELLSRLLLENIDVVTPAFATHNVRSCAYAIAQADRLGIDRRSYEFQALFGMADELKHALLEMKHRVREYCAIGEPLPGMAYLVRRLLENTSNEGFLRQHSRGDVSLDRLIENPLATLTHPPAGNDGSRTGSHSVPGRLDASDDRKTVSQDPASLPAFHNEPNADFSKPEIRTRQRAALEHLRMRLGGRCPLVIGGKKRQTAEYVPSTNPAQPSQVLGHWACAAVADADAAVAAGRSAFPAWRDTPVGERAAIIERAADLLAKRRFELNALAIMEAGKPWAEADADVSEAIDFCRYYAREMRLLDRTVVTQSVAGERCVQRWTPRGCGVVIAPWNFPLAILCGMTVAPVVAGNTVIMKPAEQTSLIASAWMDVLSEAGVPAGVVNLLTGRGEDVGAHLVSHPQIDFVAFTGSRPVGLQIWETASRTHPKQINIKRVVCEMGGKNALIIDNDADLDEAIPAALSSAFGFTGQKCSALSRLLVLEEIYDEFVRRLLGAAGAIPVGDPAEPATVIGPVIDGDAQRKILRYIEQGRGEAQLAWQATLPPELAASGGWYVPPAIFTDVRPDAVIAREEIFGPVLAVIKVRDLDEAISVANDSDYALTGGLFSRSPSALERVERELMVGNVYLNRGITGAIVERHPFGGFKMSGGGTKAGGLGYLENFLFPRAIAENILRRGFTPSEAGE